MNRYYRITNPEKPIPINGDGTDDLGVSKCEPVTDGVFRAAVGDQPSGITTDLSELLKTAGEGDVGRALAQLSRRLRFGAVMYWRLDDVTGEAEGWHIEHAG
jgi:hypothetical protein